jgi:3-isopropylmalate/(R)-2-methylmalate dehydratase small subunit
MEPFTTHTGRAIPLRRSNVDTDQIIPAEYLKRVSRVGFADGLFAAWRADPEFILNQPVADGATVLVAGPDFGIGSSREHAVWALSDYGFRAVISSRFGDIFRNNATKGGLLPVKVSADFAESLQDLLERQPDAEVTVDLAAREVRVSAPGNDEILAKAQFEIDDYTRWRLMEGLDDISLTLSHADEISAFENRRPDWLPTAEPVA